MVKAIDAILNKITMYRLVLYYLTGLILIAIIFSVSGVLHYSALGLLISTVIITAVAWVSNTLFAKIFKVPPNVESVYITAFILVLIINPPAIDQFKNSISFLIWAPFLAMASKYILNIKNKHIFNPAALAVAITSFTINQSASWWVGNSSMLIFVALGGFLIIRKIRRWDVVLGFLAAVIIAITIITVGRGDVSGIIQKAVISSPLIFFAAIMLTEPLTMPPTRDGRIAYGILVGWLLAPQARIHIANVYATPELALLVGNIFSYTISPKARHLLTVKEICEVGEGIYNFIFLNDRALVFSPGQYMEFTLGVKNPDARGNRRYFTLASSPTEKHTMLGVKFYPESSTFKKTLLALKSGDSIYASQLAGDFTLPHDKEKKLVFIAGGVGVTPFRSMIKYLIDTHEKRDIVLIYSNKYPREIVYKDVFSEGRRFGLKTIYTITDKNTGSEWTGQRGYISEAMIKKEIPDFKERIFFISGSNVMVTSVTDMLMGMGVARYTIKTDFFPGLA